MAVIATVLTTAFMYMSSQTDELLASGAKTTIEFNKTEIDLGTLKQGNPKEVTFTFTNTGSAPLLIYDVETSCGCTGAEWTKKPIEAKDTGEIRVSYDAKETGRLIKTITVYGNLINGSIRLKIKGVVE